MSNTAKSKFWDNPYWAPVAEPLKSAWHLSTHSLKEGAESLREQMEINRINKLDLGTRMNYEDARFRKYEKDMREGRHPLSYSAMEVLSAVGGMIGATICLTLGGGLGAYAASGASSVVLAGAGIVVGAVGGWVAGAAAVGVTLGITTGLARGVIKAVKHHVATKHGVSAKATGPATIVPLTQKEIDGHVNTAVKAFQSLPVEAQSDFFTALEEMIENPAQPPERRILSDIDKMSAEDRLALAGALQQKLSSEFGVVAPKQVSSDPAAKKVSVLPKIRLNHTKNSTPAGAGS